MTAYEVHTLYDDDSTGVETFPALEAARRYVACLVADAIRTGLWTAVPVGGDHLLVSRADPERCIELAIHPRPAHAADTTADEETL